MSAILEGDETDRQRLARLFEKISQEISEDGVLEKANRDDVDALSSHTTFAGADLVLETLDVAGGDAQGTFEADAVFHFNLQYGEGEDGFEAADSFPAHVTGHFFGPDDAVEIDRVQIDTQSFYE